MIVLLDQSTALTVGGVRPPAMVAFSDLLPGQRPTLIHDRILSEFPPHAVFAGLPDFPYHFSMIVEITVEAEEVDTISERKDLCLSVKLKAPGFQMGRDLPPRLTQGGLVFGDDVEVIHVAPVIFEAQHFLDKMIELVQIQ